MRKLKSYQANKRGYRLHFLFTFLDGGFIQWYKGTNNTLLITLMLCCVLIVNHIFIGGEDMWE